MGFQVSRLWNAHDNRSNNNLAYQNHSGAGQCDSPHCKKGGLASGKQPVCWQQTTGSGERTFDEAAFRLNRRNKNLTLLSYSYCITGIL